MLNRLWLGMMCLSVLCGLYTGHLDQVVVSVALSAKLAFDVALSLAGVMTFWLGIMEVAKLSGLLTLLSRALSPLMRWIFPEVPAEDPAMGAMILHMSASMLGLGNASTPFGLQAMKELDRLNPTPGEASNAMCTFLALTTSCVQIIPATGIALLAANGATQPTEIIVPSLMAGLLSMIVALALAKGLAARHSQPGLVDNCSPHPTSRDLTAGSSDVERFLDPAVKPRDVGEEKRYQQSLAKSAPESAL